MDIFLSYASEQRASAEEITLALREEGHTVFFDRTELPEGEAYNARIREAIRKSDLLIFLLAPQAVSQGRYTLTELKFAEEQWPSPSGHVLPVMVAPTDLSMLPPYLRAVVVLRPAGNVPAEVVAAVERLSRPRWRRTIRPYAAALLISILLAGGFGIWRVVENKRICSQALPLMATAKLHHDGADYAAAWEGYAKALAICPTDAEATKQQQQVAMDWLDNIHATPGKESFTDIVTRVQPALSSAGVSKDDVRAADGLAHLGWADFLRSRDGKQGLDPVHYYQQAIQRDPQNPYAHAYWGHYILVTSGDVKQAKAHFEQALAAKSRRPFVRTMELAGLVWRDGIEQQDEVARVANEMREQGEVMPSIGGHPFTSRLWNVYYDRLVRGNDRADFIDVLRPGDHLATFAWLFPDYARSTSNRSAYLFMLAQLQEHSGAQADALATYRSVAALTTEQGIKSGRMVDEVKLAIRRLQAR
jgi:tetratricopeptide (TPR) repeat protein